MLCPANLLSHVGSGYAPACITKHWWEKTLTDYGQFTQILSAKYLTNGIHFFIYISCLGAVTKVLSTKIILGMNPSKFFPASHMTNC